MTKAKATSQDQGEVNSRLRGELTSIGEAKEGLESRMNIGDLHNSHAGLTEAESQRRSFLFGRNEIVVPLESIFMLMVKAIPGEKVHDMIALKSNMKTLNMHWTKDRGRRL